MKRPSFSCFSVFSQVFRNTKLAKVILADGPRGCDMFAAAFNAAYAPWVHDESSVIQAVMPGSHARQYPPIFQKRSKWSDSMDFDVNP